MRGSLLSCRDVAVEFPVAGKVLRAVDGVDVDVEPGTTVAVVGESGCGKSTLARAIMGLGPVTRGSITALMLRKRNVITVAGKARTTMVFAQSLTYCTCVVMGTPRSTCQRGRLRHGH